MRVAGPKLSHSERAGRAATAQIERYGIPLKGRYFMFRISKRFHWVVFVAGMGIAPLIGQRPTGRPTSPPIPWTPLQGAWYQLSAKHSGKLLDVEGGPSAQQDGVRVIQYSDNGGDNQKWRFSSLGNGE